MECISGTCQINFSLDKFPLQTLQEGMKILSSVEGTLLVIVQNITIFREDGILLLEFTYALNKWFKEVGKGNYLNFSYSSMDFEEQGILSFTKRDDEKWWISSVWMELEPEYYVETENLVKASNSFILKIKNILDEQTCSILDLG